MLPNSNNIIIQYKWWIFNPRGKYLPELSNSPNNVFKESGKADSNYFNHLSVNQQQLQNVHCDGI